MQPPIRCPTEGCLVTSSMMSYRHLSKNLPQKGGCAPRRARREPGGALGEDGGHPADRHPAAAHPLPMAGGRDVCVQSWGHPPLREWRPEGRSIVSLLVGCRHFFVHPTSITQISFSRENSLEMSVTSDELPHYAHALLEVYGVWDTPPRQGTRGRFPQPRRYPPPDLCYAVVVKERARGRVVHVMTRLVYGTTEQVETALRRSPVSRTITTYGVERQNLTVRQHSRRMGRKVNAFSKAPAYLEEQLTVAFAYDHCVIPHRSLRQRLACPLPTKGGKGSSKKWKSMTPAMAVGLTDHVWTMDELLSFRVPPKSLWL